MKNFKIIVLILAGSLIASAIMQKFTPNNSWVAFAGWVIFFIALQLPWVMGSISSYGSCTQWLRRFRKKSI